MAQKPTFFFSHTRKDRESGPYLGRFFEDLEKGLAQWLGVDLDEERLGTIDMRVGHGEDWDAHLIRGLRSDKVFVLVLTPYYFNRPNCGKELAVFLRRSLPLVTDANGALTGVKNVMPIRWLPEAAYSPDGKKDDLIPRILRRIEDAPADPGGDPERTRAIERYRKCGMKRCVQTEDYPILIDLFVERIRDMPALPPLPASQAVSFADAPNAFSHDWRAQLGFVSSATPPIPPSPPQVTAPAPLTSIVVFNLTRQPLLNAQEVTEPAFDALSNDLREAANVEDLQFYERPASISGPNGPEVLLDDLAKQSALRRPTALLVEPDIWPGGANGERAAVEQIIRSSRWVGPVLVATVDATGLGKTKLVLGHEFARQVIPLRHASDDRIKDLRHAFAEARGCVLRTSTEFTPGAEQVPRLTGLGTERA